MQNELNPLLLFSSPWQRIPFFHGLPNDCIHQLLKGAQHSQTKAKTIIFEQGEDADHFGFVIEGLVRLYRYNSKRQRVIMDFAGPGAMIGGLLMAHPKITYPITAQAIISGQFLKIPKQTYLDHWMSFPEVIKRTQNANLERMEAIHSTREIHKFPLDQKIAHILLRMSPHDENNLILKISRTDLADTAGACVESVIRVFSQWEKDQLIKQDPTGQEIISKQDLQQRYC